MDDHEFDPNQEFDPADPGNLEVARRLDAYADARLTPSADATVRTRAAVMSAAHRQAALADAGTAAAVSAATAAAAAPPPPRTWLRAIVAVAAIVLTVAVVVGATKGTDPGAPFYPTRVGVEAVNLPGDLAARASAQVTRLESRLREANLSASAQDSPAVQAAMTAYVEILVATETDAHGDPRATSIIIVNVTRYVTDLDALAAKAPAPARPSVAEAKAKSQSVLADLGGAN